jgi:excisionase family DNA binding protein
MQAYASAVSIPPASEFRLPHLPTVVQGAPVDVGGEVAARPDSSAVLASLILDGLDDRGLAVLARRLLPHLREPAASHATPARVAYTVPSLAAELGVSPKTIRCSIARHELAAVKRGSRWIISADAVHAWATASDRRRWTGSACGATAPKVAGPSLRSVLCRGASRGGAR